MPSHTTHTLNSAQIKDMLALRDLTDPAQGCHAMQLIIQRVEDALNKRYNDHALTYRGPRVVPVEYNYDRLLIDIDAASRDKRYTRYVSADTMLRSHTSAMIPMALEALASNPPKQKTVLTPGIVYRRDQIDRVHTGEPHQMDIWRIQHKDYGKLAAADLTELIYLICNAIDPAGEVEINNAIHPYTLDGKEIYLNGLEIGECGLAHPKVLEDAGLSEYTGLAMGIGLDRLLMILKGIDDIRLLRSEDKRVAAQMKGLQAYKSVSNYPAISRDLSLALSADWDIESIGDAVRDELREKAEWVENIQVISESGYNEMPSQAIERLGMRPEQVNVLLRLILRHPTETLTRKAANELRLNVYRRLHEGDSWALA